MLRFLYLAFLCSVAMPLAAETAPYAGQEQRAIKSLSHERVEGLRAGAGLGYAKAAELNGWPGPLHALELSNELELSEEQHQQITRIREHMLAKAKPLGHDLIAAEAQLDALFAELEPVPDAVLKATFSVAGIEAQLRAVHLIAHIEMKPLLSRHQQMLYAQHRGYAGAGGGHDGHSAH